MFTRRFHGSNTGIRLRVEFRLGDPSKKRYSVWRGFPGNINSDALAFRPNRRELFKHGRVAELAERGHAGGLQKGPFRTKDVV
jgi:hypothetical protein